MKAYFIRFYPVYSSFKDCLPYYSLNFLILESIFSYCCCGPINDNLLGKSLAFSSLALLVDH